MSKEIKGNRTGKLRAAYVEEHLPISHWIEKSKKQIAKASATLDVFEELGAIELLDGKVIVYESK